MSDNPSWKNRSKRDEYYNSEEYKQHMAELNKHNRRAAAFNDVPLMDFTSKMCASIVAGNQGSGNKNLCLSPASFYYSLGVCACASRGGAQQEILNALGVENVSDVEEWFKFVHDSLNPIPSPIPEWNEDPARFVLKSSFWGNENAGVSFHEDFTSRIHDEMNTDCCTLVFNDSASNEVTKWGKDATDGFLSPSISLDADTAMVLISLLYFRGIWSDEFYEEKTYEDIFHAASGDVQASFMHDADEGKVFRGDGFMAAVRGIGRCKMMFYLPDEGVDINELANTKEGMRKLLDAHPDEKVMLKWHLPKFDIASSSVDFTACAKEMGVKTAFEPSDAFEDVITSPDSDKAYMSKIEQDTRIAIDEHGCEAASLTISRWMCLGMSPMMETIEYKLDRPFAFAILDDIRVPEEYRTDGMNDKKIPLFFGIVNDPLAH